jgi:hypothetical protein
MLQFFSASTNIVNSKRAITECLENALEGQGSLDCDLIIIYSAMGHNFKDLLLEARKLSPGARIVGCTGAGIIGKEGPDESMKALAIMAIKGPKNEFAIINRKTNLGNDPYIEGAEMARELKSMNPNINMIQFLPPPFEWIPFDKAIEGIKSVFGFNIPIFGGVSMDNNKGITSFQFFDEQVLEKSAIMIGFADSTLKFISQANHGFNVLDKIPFQITRSKPGCIFEFNNQPANKFLTEALDIPESTYFMDILAIAGFAKELPEELQEEFGSKYILFTIMGKNDDGSILIPVTCQEGMKIWLTRRDEKKMFEGVDWMVKKICDRLDGRKPLAVFHADCALRGNWSLNRILKDEIINHLQAPLFGGGSIPWLGLYSGGEFAMIGGQVWFNQISSSLFVIYR